MESRQDAAAASSAARDPHRRVHPPVPGPRVDGAELRDRPLGRMTAVTVWSHSQGAFPLRDAIAAGLGLDAAPGNRQPRRGRGRLRPQRRRRRRPGRGAAGPGRARAAGPRAVDPRGRDGLGAARPGHAGPAVRRARRSGQDRDLAAGRVEQRLHRPPRPGRRATAAGAVPPGGRAADVAGARTARRPGRWAPPATRCPGTTSPTWRSSGTGCSPCRSGPRRCARSARSSTCSRSSRSWTSWPSAPGPTRWTSAWPT